MQALFLVLGRCIIVSSGKFVRHGCIFKLAAASHQFLCSHLDSRFSFCHPHPTASMKVAALALLVAGVTTTAKGVV